MTEPTKKAAIDPIVEIVSEVPVGYLILAVLAGVALATLVFYIVSQQQVPTLEPEYPPTVTEDA